MKWLIAALGLVLLVAGCVAMIEGYPIIQVERGWAGVISGAVLLAGGAIVLAIGLALLRIEKLLARPHVAAGGQRATPNTVIEPAIPKAPENIADIPAAPRLTEPVAEPAPPRAPPEAARNDRPRLGIFGRSAPAAAPAHVTVADPVAEPALSPSTNTQESRAWPEPPPAPAVEPAAQPVPALTDPLVDSIAAALTPAVEAAPAPRNTEVPPASLPEPVVPDGIVTTRRFPLRNLTLPRGVWPASPAAVANVTASPPDPDPAPAVGAPEAKPAPNVSATADQPDWFERALSGADEAAVASASVMPAPPPPAPAPPAPEPHADIIGRYETDGATYVMYADGSIDATNEDGVFRFGSLDELKAFIENGKT